MTGRAVLGDDLGHRQTQRHVHWDGQDVFRHQHFEPEFSMKR